MLNTNRLLYIGSKPSVRRFCMLIALLSSMLLVVNHGYSQSENIVNLTLKDLINNAFQHNLELEVSKKEFLLNNLEQAAHSSNLKPKVSAYSNYIGYYADQPISVFPENSWQSTTTNSGNEYNYVPTGQPSNLGFGLLFEQTLFDYRLLIGKKSKTILKEIENTQIQKSQTEIAYEIAKQFYELNELRTRQSLLTANKKRLQKAVNVLRIQVQNDMTLNSELEKTSLKLNKIEILEQRLNSGIDTKYEYLKTLAGLPENSNLNLILNITDTVPLQNMPLENQNESLNYTLLQHLLQSNRVKASAQKSEYLPKLNFIADVNWLSQSSGMSNMFESENINHQGFMGLRLNIPIYSGGAYRNLEHKANVQNDIYKLKQQQIIIGEKIQSKKLNEELISYGNELTIQQKLEAVSANEYKQAENRFTEGIININSLLEAEENFNKTVSEKNEILLKIKLTELELLKLSGGIDNLYK